MVSNQIYGRQSDLRHQLQNGNFKTNQLLIDEVDSVKQQQQNKPRNPAVKK